MAARGLALDLGSSRTRAWVPGHGLLTDPLLGGGSGSLLDGSDLGSGTGLSFGSGLGTGPGLSSGFGLGSGSGTGLSSGLDLGTGTGTGPGLGGDAERPVRRGRIVDPESCGRLLGRIADAALGPDRTDSVIVLSHPVLAGAVHRNAARELLAGLGPTRVLVLSSARAAAAYAGPRDAGPLLVVDMGAELTEVTLLVGGRIADARQAESGLSDLDPATLPATLVGTVLDMVKSMWRQDRHGAIRGALRKGPVLAGGGALRPDVTDRLARCLGTPVRLAEDPSTTVVRGAGRILSSVLRHGVTTSVLPGRPR